MNSIIKYLALFLTIFSFNIHAQPKNSNWDSAVKPEPAELAPHSITGHPEMKGAIAIVDAWIDGLQSYRNVPGVSVGFVVDQELIYSKGFGYSNLRRKVPANADTLYSVCSISKLFTSIGIMQMRDAGKLSLRDPVSDHLDWFNIKLGHQNSGPTRIQGLLTHSSGLPRESDFPYWSDPKFPFPTLAQLKDQLGNQTTLYPADSQFQYSNLGLTLAGEILRQYAGLSYADYVQERILAPLEMRDTRPYFPEKLHGKQMAVGYAGLQRDLKRKKLPPFNTRSIAPAAGFTSSVNDLAKFASWNFRTLSGEKNDVLDSNTLREMHRVHWVDPDWKISWGLGFVVRQANKQTVVGHSGGCPGYITHFSMVPKHKIAAIALTNASDGPAGAISQAMLKTLGSALKKANAKTNQTEEQKPVIDLSQYEGNYGTEVWGGETAVRQWGDKLATINIPSIQLKEIVMLKHVVDNTFVRLTDDGEEREQWHFITDAKGKVTGFKQHGAISTRLNLEKSVES